VTALSQLETDSAGGDMDAKTAATCFHVSPH
jgi:hypothetical protein